MARCHPAAWRGAITAAWRARCHHCCMARCIVVQQPLRGIWSLQASPVPHRCTWMHAHTHENASPATRRMPTPVLGSRPTIRPRTAAVSASAPCSACRAWTPRGCLGGVQGAGLAVTSLCMPRQRGSVSGGTCWRTGSIVCGFAALGSKVRGNLQTLVGSIQAAGA